MSLSPEGTCCTPAHFHLRTLPSSGSNPPSNRRSTPIGRFPTAYRRGGATWLDVCAVTNVTRARLSLLACLSLLGLEGAGESVPGGIDPCARRDTLVVMPLRTEAELADWKPVALAYRGHFRNAEPEELHLYQEAAPSLARYVEAAEALIALINHYRHRDPGGNVYLQYADELSMILAELPPTGRGAQRDREREDDRGLRCPGAPPLRRGR